MTESAVTPKGVVIFLQAGRPRPHGHPHRRYVNIAPEGRTFAAGFAIAQPAHVGTRIVLINGRTRPKSTTGETQMRFMMIVIPKGYEKAAPDAVPSAEAVAK